MKTFKFSAALKNVFNISEFRYIPAFYYKSILISLLSYFIFNVIIEFFQQLSGKSESIESYLNNISEDTFIFISSLAIGVLYLKFIIRKNLKDKQNPHHIEELFLILKKFMHGESLLMNLNRLSLLAKNFELPTQLITKTSTENQEKNFIDFELIERFNIAAIEFKKNCLRELYKLHAILLEMTFVNSYYHTSAKAIYNNSGIIVNELKLLSDASGLNCKIKEDEFIKSRNNLIRSVAQLKNELSNLVEFVKTNLSVDLQEVFFLVKAKFRSNGKDIPQIKNNLTCDGRKAVISPGVLVDIVSILIQNSFQAFEIHGSEREDKIISVGSYSNEDKIFLKIEDNGPGIADNYKKIIFNDGISSKSTGHGFGLYYIKKCVEKYGGKVWCEDSSLGGAAIIIELLKAP